MNLIDTFVDNNELICTVVFISDLIKKDKVKEYCYITNIHDLKENDIVIVDTIYGNALAVFKKYTNSKSAKKRATKKILKKLDYYICKRGK